uniref:Phospholipid-transporting ATPase IIB n=1 Tax=Macrostomum lignano TaxID=282301 RepID=A0A1I8GX49_9PLAT
VKKDWNSNYSQYLRRKYAARHESLAEVLGAGRGCLCRHPALPGIFYGHGQRLCLCCRRSLAGAAAGHLLAGVLDRWPSPGAPRCPVVRVAGEREKQESKSRL